MPNNVTWLIFHVRHTLKRDMTHLSCSPCRITRKLVFRVRHTLARTKRSSKNPQDWRARFNSSHKRVCKDQHTNESSRLARETQLPYFMSRFKVWRTWNESCHVIPPYLKTWHDNFHTLARTKRSRKNPQDWRGRHNSLKYCDVSCLCVRALLWHQVVAREHKTRYKHNSLKYCDVSCLSVRALQLGAYKKIESPQIDAGGILIKSYESFWCWP